MSEVEDVAATALASRDSSAIVMHKHREQAEAVLGTLSRAGYTIISTETLRAALNFGYGKEPTPEGVIARANLREQLT